MSFSRYRGSGHSDLPGDTPYALLTLSPGLDGSVFKRGECGKCVYVKRVSFKCAPVMNTNVSDVVSKVVWL